MKTGTIDISDLSQPPLKSEFLTAKLLASRGKNIKFLEPNKNKYVHTPDIRMDGLYWEAIKLLT